MGPRPRAALFWLVLLFGGAFAFFDEIDSARLSAALHADYAAFEAEAGAECVALSWQHRKLLVALDQYGRGRNMSSAGDRGATSRDARDSTSRGGQERSDDSHDDDENSPLEVGDHLAFDAASVPAMGRADGNLPFVQEGPQADVQAVALPSRTAEKRSRRQLSQLPTTSSPTACLKFVMVDLFGDGWNGATYRFRDAVTNMVVAIGTLDSGTQGTDDVCVSNGCYELQVTAGAYDSEIAWAFGTLSGGAPYGPWFIAIIENVIEGPYQSCPTPTPTQTFLPTPSPTLTPPPSVSPAPSNPPSQAPTSSPTSKRFETRTWSELHNALQVDHASVKVIVDILFTHPIMMHSGQDVTAFCNTTGSRFIALDGGGETRLFVIHGGACLRLIGLRTMNGYSGAGEEAFHGRGGAFHLSSGSKLYLTACRIDNNEAWSGGAFYLNNAVASLSACSVSQNQAGGGGGACYLVYGAVALSDCDVNNNEANGYGGAFFLYVDAEAHISRCTIKKNTASYDGAVVFLYIDNAVDILDSVVSGNEAEGYGGVAQNFYLSAYSGGPVTVDGCTLSENTAYIGGLFAGQNIVVRNSVVKHNFATWGGVLDGSGAFENCLIANNTALAKGGIVHISNGATTFLHCAMQHNTAEYGSVARTNLAADDSIGLVIDGSSVLNNADPAIESTAPVVIRNTQGITRADIANVSAVLRCSDSDASAYCLTEYCSDVSSPEDINTLLGINCYCYPDGQTTDPLDASCASSASMSDPVAGVMIATEDVWIVVNKPETSSVVIQFSNLGDVQMHWGLFISSNPERLVWHLSNRSGSLAAGEPWSITLQISSDGLQARDAAFVTNFTLNASSPVPTPIPEIKAVHFVVYTVVSAVPITAAGYVNVTNRAQLTAAGTVKFDVFSIDATGMAILDAADVAYSAVLFHSASGDTGSCRPVLFDPSTNRHSGECALPDNRVCNRGNKSAEHSVVECELSERSFAVGEFVLTINDGQGMIVGGSQMRMDVASCPMAYYKSKGGCYLCPPGTECEKGTALQTLQLLPGYWRSGVFICVLYVCVCKRRTSALRCSAVITTYSCRYRIRSCLCVHFRDDRMSWLYQRRSMRRECQRRRRVGLLPVWICRTFLLRMRRAVLSHVAWQ